MAEAISSTTNLSEISSTRSVYSADGGQGDYEVTGSVQLMIWYHKHILYVRVIQAKDLACNEEGYPPCPYIKACVMPDALMVTKRKTKIKIGTCDPTFNECFEYKIPSIKIHSKILLLNVWNWDRYGRNSFLGEVNIRLTSANLSDTSEQWYPLQQRIYELQHAGKGSIRFALKYEPANRRCLSVFVHQMKYLLHSSSKISYFVRGLLLPEQIVQKTSCVDKRIDPEWKEELKFYNVTYDDLRTKKVLELSLWNSDGTKNYEFIGCIRLGPMSDQTRTKYWMDSNDLEYCVWSAMLTHTRQWMDALIELRPSIASYLDYNLEYSTTEGTSITSKDPASSVESYVKSNPPIVDQYKITGRVLLKLEFSSGHLVWHVLKAENLAAVVRDRLSNPYTQVSMSCNNTIVHTWKSKVRRRTVNPVYYESSKFKIEEKFMEYFKLKVSLWHSEKNEEQKTLGCFEIELSKFKSWGRPHWFSLDEDKKITGEIAPSNGNLTLSLKFEEKDNVSDYIYGTLHVYINHARGLPYKASGSQSHCYIIVSSMSLPQPQRSEKVLMQSRNIIWRHQFSFTNLSFDNLCYETCIDITVRKEHNGSSSLMGGLRMGPAPLPGYTSRYMDSNVLETNHWDQMLSNPGEWVECTHTLRENMKVRKLTPNVGLPSIRSSEKMENSIGKLVLTAMFERMKKKFRFKGNLYVKIKEGQQLPCRNAKGVFAVCKISPHFHWEWKNNSTEVSHNLANPSFEKVFMFEDMFQDDLQLRHVLDVTVFEDNGSPSFAYVGRLCLGPDRENSIPREILHWEQIFHNPGEWVEYTHFLRY